MTPEAALARVYFHNDATSGGVVKAFGDLGYSLIPTTEIDRLRAALRHAVHRDHPHTSWCDECQRITVAIGNAK